MVRPKLRALIVEDNESDAALLVRELRRAYDVEFVVVDDEPSMRAALARAAWDVIVSDYSMPRFDVLRALRVAKESTTDAPFLVVSGTVGEDTAVEAMRAGAQDFLIKDHFARLLPAIERELREAAIRRERLALLRRAEEERERLLAELRDAVSARDAFLGIASHELRTPLTSLKLSVQSLARTNKREGLTKLAPKAVGDRLDAIDRQVARLEMLVKGLLDVSRLTSLRSGLADAEDVDLGALVKEVIAELVELHRQERAEVRVHDDGGVVGRWHRGSIEAIAANLVSNALKFGAGAPIDVTIARGGRGAILRVADRGIGIPPEAQARVFEKFERAVPDRHYGGFGLGLWVVRNLAEAHGGAVRVESEAGRGSTFEVDLPLAAP